jgi:Leucine-rich repeat (LRR) protein
LKELRVDDNRLSHLPPEIGALSKLSFLDCAHNQLKTLPPTIGWIEELEYLSLAQNQLTHLPVEIGHLFALTKLFLNDNKVAPHYHQDSPIFLQLCRPPPSPKTPLPTDRSCPLY